MFQSTSRMSRICNSMSLQFTMCGHAPAKSEDAKAPGRHLCFLERHLESRSQRPHQNKLTTERKLFCQALALQAYRDGFRRLGSQRHFVALPMYLNASATWARASTSGPQVPHPGSLLEQRQAILAIQHVQ